jgi:hypothetical protein
MKESEMNRGLILAICSLALLALSNCAQPTDPAQADEVLQVVYESRTHGYAMDIYVGDDNVYVAEDQAGFSIYNHQLEQLSYTYYQGMFENMRLIQAVEEVDLLFIYDRFGSPAQYRLFDVSDPVQPNLFDSITTNTARTNDFKLFLKEDGNIEIFWVRYDGGGQIFHALYNYDENSGTWSWGGIQHSSTHHFTVFGFDVDDDYIYVTSEQLGLYIIDKETHNIVGNVTTIGQAIDVKVVDNLAYVACKEEGLSIIDVSDPTEPHILSEKNTSGWAQSVDVQDGLVAIGSGGGGAYLFDASEPTAPIQIGRVTSSRIGYTYSVMFHGNRVYASTKTGIYALGIDY